MNSQAKKKYLNYVDEEEKAKEAGFRNFISFAAIFYYGKKFSLKNSGEVIGVSASKMRTSLEKRSFPLRKAGLIPGTAPKEKRRVDIWAKVRENTKFNSPKEAFRVLYEEYFLTSYEVGDVLKISQPLVCKFLRKYGIKVRKQGTRKLRRDK